MPGRRHLPPFTPCFCPHPPFIPAAHDPAHELRITRKHEQNSLPPSEQLRLVRRIISILQQISLIHGIIIRLFRRNPSSPLRRVPGNQRTPPVRILRSPEGEHPGLRCHMPNSPHPGILHTPKQPMTIRLPCEEIRITLVDHAISLCPIHQHLQLIQPIRLRRIPRFLNSLINPEPTRRVIQPLRV